MVSRNQIYIGAIRALEEYLLIILAAMLDHLMQDERSLELMLIGL